ncbi:hypothetical protein SDC9_103237 [bioreactor metagenome]|uniref:Uncharacterized protein n=1 Tax=bioreactor metagenome TaxID=1076179 RepID=A0A645B3X9_9ZZZZ
MNGLLERGFQGGDDVVGVVTERGQHGPVERLSGALSCRHGIGGLMGCRFPDVGGDLLGGEVEARGRRRGGRRLSGSDEISPVGGVGHVHAEGFEIIDQLADGRQGAEGHAGAGQAGIVQIEAERVDQGVGTHGYCSFGRGTVTRWM